MNTNASSAAVYLGTDIDQTVRLSSIHNIKSF